MCFSGGLCDGDADTAGSLDLVLGRAGEESRLDDDGLGRESSLAEDLEETALGNIDHWSSGRVLGGGNSLLFGDERPELVQVDRAEKENHKKGITHKQALYCSISII